MENGTTPPAPKPKDANGTPCTSPESSRYDSVSRFAQILKFASAALKGMLHDIAGHGREDIVARTAYAVIRQFPIHPELTTDDAALESYTRKAALRQFLTARKSDKARNDRECRYIVYQDVLRDLRPSGVDLVDMRMLHDELKAAVRQLDPPIRKCIIARFLLGMKYREIGARLKIPARTARFRVQQGAIALRKPMWARRPEGYVEREPRRKEVS
jgi:DNA-directed RNA polymerase specialized sigma24 family protein